MNSIVWWRIHEVWVFSGCEIRNTTFISSRLVCKAMHIIFFNTTDFFNQSPGNSMLCRYDSDASITDASSVVSGPQSSMLSDGRSSMLSIMQGSYAPESYMTDGYESEPYLTSIGTSASRAAFRAGRDPRISKWDINSIGLLLVLISVTFMACF